MLPSRCSTSRGCMNKTSKQRIQEQDEISQDELVNRIVQAMRHKIESDRVLNQRIRSRIRDAVLRKHTLQPLPDQPDQTRRFAFEDAKEWAIDAFKEDNVGKRAFGVPESRSVRAKWP